VLDASEVVELDPDPVLLPVVILMRKCSVQA
jgi:hypothetical protein